MSGRSQYSDLSFDIRVKRIHAIPLAEPSHFGLVQDNRELQRVRHNYGIDGDYIFSVGSIQPRTNLARLVRAYASLRGGNSADKLPKKLVLVGKCAWLYDETLRALDFDWRETARRTLAVYEEAARERVGVFGNQN